MGLTVIRSSLLLGYGSPVTLARARGFPSSSTVPFAVTFSFRVIFGSPFGYLLLPLDPLSIHLPDNVSKVTHKVRELGAIHDFVQRPASKKTVSRKVDADAANRRSVTSHRVQRMQRYIP